MKKFLGVAIILALASTVSATTLSWDVGSIYWTGYGMSGTVYIVSDDDQPYQTVWIDDTDGGLITSITALPAAGSEAVVQNPTQTGYTDWWTVEASDSTSPFTIASGNQFGVVVQTPWSGEVYSWDIVLDGYSPYPVGGPTTLTIIIPEPMSIALLGLGGLLLLRRRRIEKG
ncbi:MAG: PEP-CTERM sorting domain-containing protein [Planctomycetota bacterium]|jgi:hypothetical protein